MELKKALILAGGYGSRISQVEPNLPKALISVTDKPILYFIIKELIKNEIEEFYFSLGYMASQIIDYMKNNFPNLNCIFHIESEPLGTGGAVRNTLKQLLLKIHQQELIQQKKLG